VQAERSERRCMSQEGLYYAGKLMETIHGALLRTMERELVSVGTVDISAHIQNMSAIAARVEQERYA